MQTKGKNTGPRGIPTTQLRGGITQADMIRLEMRKKEFFLDYGNVEKYLSQVRAKNRGESVPAGQEIKTVSLVSNSTQLDDAFNPLSSRIITDK